MIVAAALATLPLLFAKSGTIRAYVYQRINKVGQNQRAWNFGGTLHADVTLKSRPLTLGASYAFADPLGTNGSDPQHNAALDNTLPGYSYSALSELYAQYRTWSDFAQIGRMSIDTPFVNPADKRLIPITFQGAQVRHYFGGGWNVALMQIARFKSRTSSTFDANNLLTQVRTPGFALLEVSHGSRALNVSADQYWFADVASLTYLSAQVRVGEGSMLAAQTVIEDQAGRALAGTIHNHTYGLQFATRSGGVDVSLGFDYAPAVTFVTTNPASIFRPVGAPAPVALGGGRFSVLGGGIASPYTDSLTSDPLFTTSLTASQSDRRSAGTSYKLALSGTGDSGHVPWAFSQSHFDFGAVGTTDETDADITLNLGRIDPTKLYTGLSLRQRWGYRITNTAPLRFLYSRTQLQYTF